MPTKRRRANAKTAPRKPTTKRVRATTTPRKPTTKRVRAKAARAQRGGTGNEKVAKLGIEREAGKLYSVFNGDVFVAKREGSDNVVFIPPLDAFQLLRKTGIVPEPGYLYFLDADGDLARIRRS